MKECSPSKIKLNPAEEKTIRDKFKEHFMAKCFFA
jgi:hypothetical protein